MIRIRSVFLLQNTKQWMDAKNCPQHSSEQNIAAENCANEISECRDGHGNHVPDGHSEMYGLRHRPVWLA